MLVVGWGGGGGCDGGLAGAAPPFCPRFPSPWPSPTGGEGRISCLVGRATTRVRPYVGVLAERDGVVGWWHRVRPGRLHGFAPVGAFLLSKGSVDSFWLLPSGKGYLLRAAWQAAVIWVGLLGSSWLAAPSSWSAAHCAAFSALRGVGSSR